MKHILLFCSVAALLVAQTNGASQCSQLTETRDNSLQPPSSFNILQTRINFTKQDAVSEVIVTWECLDNIDGYLISWSQSRDNHPNIIQFFSALSEPDAVLYDTSPTTTALSSRRLFYVYTEKCVVEGQLTIPIAGVLNGTVPSETRFFIHMESIKDKKRSNAVGHNPWKITENCLDDDRYLDNTLENLAAWRCRKCPTGGSCRGEVVLKDLTGKAGFWRLGSVDTNAQNSSSPPVFWPCSNPLACMGNINKQLENKYKGKWSFTKLSNSSILKFDQPEKCNTDLGFRETCVQRNGQRTTCRLCRACRHGYYPYGVAGCARCPSAAKRILIVCFAMFFLVLVVTLFLTAASERDSNPHSHLAQPLQKIILNHLHLISLAGALPLRWPLDLQNFFVALDVLTRFSGYIINPTCDDANDHIGGTSSKFFHKQALVLSLPLFAVLGALAYWECVRFFPTFLEFKFVMLLRHCWRRTRRRAACCWSCFDILEKGGDVPMNASECFDRFHLYAHQSKVHFVDDTHHLRLSRLSIFDLLYALSVDGRHRELHLRLNTDAEDNDIHHDIKLNMMIPTTAKPGELLNVKFVHSQNVSLLVPLDAIPGKVCEIQLDKGTQRKLGPMECIYLSMQPEPEHGSITFQNFYKWYHHYATDVHSHKLENERDLDRDEDMVEKLDFVLHIISGPTGAHTIVIPLDSSGVVQSGSSSTVSLEQHLPGHHGFNCEFTFFIHSQKCKVQNTSTSVCETWMTVDGTPLDPQKKTTLDDDSLIKICARDGTETDVIVEIAARGMYHSHATQHNSQSHAFTIPTRKELEQIFLDALEAQQALAAVRAHAFGNVKATHSVLEWNTFRQIVHSHPTIFGVHTSYKSTASTYVRFRIKCREAGLDRDAPPLGSLKNMLLHGQDAVGCRLEIFWEDGQSKKADLDLQPFLIFAKLKGGKTTGINKNEAKEASNLERHSLFGEKDRDTKKGRWFTGVIDLYDPKTDKHHFTYDGDMDEWWYDLKHVRHRFKGYGVIQQLAEKHAKAHQFSAFASIAFSVALQRRHCHQKLETARKRHKARTELKHETKFLAHGTSNVRRSQELLEESERAADIQHSDKVVATIVTLIYLLYPTMCSAAFSLTACQPIGASRSYLQQDLEVLCYGEVHLAWFMLLCVPALLSLVVGIPLFTFVLLRRSNMLHRRTRYRYGILTIGFQPYAYYWELCIAGRKLLTSAIGVYMLRSDPSMQALTSEILVVIALVLHLTVEPYHEVTPKKNSLQHAETFALTVAFVTLVCGIVLTESTVKYGTFYTFVIVSTNCLFLATASWWYFVLMRMDLENMIEKMEELHWLSNGCLQCLTALFPDWEKAGRIAELDREEAEAVEDMKHMDLRWAARIKEIAHRWVVSHRRRKTDGHCNIVPAGRGPIEMSSAEHALKRANSIERRSELAVKQFHVSLDEKRKKSVKRLEMRRRTASQKQLRQGSSAFIHFVVPEHVELSSLGFKLRWVHSKCILYNLLPMKLGARQGLKNGSILLVAGGVPMTDEKLFSSILFKRPLEMVFNVPIE